MPSQTRFDRAAASRPAAGAKRARLAVTYLAMVLAPIALILFSLHAGGPGTPGAAPPGGVKKPGPDVFGALLVGLPFILACAHLTGRLCRRIGQPPVIGEILAGIMLGPSLLGRVWPAGESWLFPAYLTPTINTLAQIGLVFFMFLVGYELNLHQIRHRGYSAALISHASIALPMLAGIVLALAMYHRFAGPGVGFPVFGLFLGVAMSITAFPVLARILTDRGLERSPLGALALACAAVDDLTAWCLLALVTALAQHGPPSRVLLTVALSAVFVAAMHYLVRPLLARVAAAYTGGRRVLPATAVLPFLLGALMLCACATNWIGIHPIFGAFLLGAVTPRDWPPIRTAVEHLHSVTVVLLLPLFFVYTGLHTKLDSLGADVGLWGWCLLITAVAMFSKWAGSTAAARVSGIDWRESLSLGALMNCRGLTELVVLDVGYQLKVISPTVFTLLVVMALVTTGITAPALSAIDRALPVRPLPAAPQTRTKTAA